MDNVKMLRTCHIGEAEYPKGSVHAQKDIKTDRLYVWLQLGLAVETDEDLTELVAQEAVRELEVAEKKKLETTKGKAKGEARRASEEAERKSKAKTRTTAKATIEKDKDEGAKE